MEAASLGGNPDLPHRRLQIHHNVRGILKLKIEHTIALALDVDIQTTGVKHLFDAVEHASGSIQKFGFVHNSQLSLKITE